MGAASLGKANFFNVGLDDFRIECELLALVVAIEMFQTQYGKFMQSANEVDFRGMDIHRPAITPFAVFTSGRTSRSEHHHHPVQ